MKSSGVTEASEQLFRSLFHIPRSRYWLFQRASSQKQLLGSLVVAGTLSTPVVSFAAETDVAGANTSDREPDLTHDDGTVPEGVLEWDQTDKSTEAVANQEEVLFVFNFKNNSDGPVAILGVKSSCGCTTAQMPALPWLLASGTVSAMPITVNLTGKTGSLVKTVNIMTDKGGNLLTMRINILPPVTRTLTAEDRARNMIAAKADRQAVFKNDCASCHVEPGKGKYGKELYDTVCAICHEAEHRGSMVPDLHHLKSPTSQEYWQVWIERGKPGTLMPAFSSAEGGPLNEMQIATLAAYLNASIPAKVTEAQK